MAFRKLPLPAGVKGRVYLHSMPGRYRPFPEDEAEAQKLGITTTIRLTTDRETGGKSPEYMDSIEHRLLRWEELHFPIPDYGIPEDLAAFEELLARAIAKLRAGERLLIHCAAGIGRTGTMAAALLVGLGVELEEAVRRVEAAGSHAEDEGQVNFLRLLAAGERSFGN